MAQRKQFLLRLPPELHDALRRWADDELRSLNGQIEFLLREALRRHGRVKDDPPLPGENTGVDPASDQ